MIMEMKNVFEEKAVVANELGRIYEYLQSRLNDLNTKYDVIGQSQATNWKTGELLWEDEEQTIPKMSNDYGTVPKIAEDYTDDDRIRIATIEKVMKMLEKAL